MFMNVFSTYNNGPSEITIDKFVEATDKKYPYFQTDSKGKEKHYAICPECGNPIQIINLFGQEYEEQITKKRNTHARHTGRDIPGLPKHNQLKYLSCPLHNAKSFSCKQLRNDEIYNSNLLSLINNNMSKIRKDIREITGINFSKDYLDKIIQTYINSGHYSYIHTHKFNIPYSILFTSSSLDLYSRYINSNSSISNDIKQIIRRSANFEIISKEDNNLQQILKKNCAKGFWNLILKIANHDVKNNTLQLSILEYKNDIDKAKPIDTITIAIRPCIYDDKCNP